VGSITITDLECEVNSLPSLSNAREQGQGTNARERLSNLRKEKLRMSLRSESGEISAYVPPSSFSSPVLESASGASVNGSWGRNADGNGDTNTNTNPKEIIHSPPKSRFLTRRLHSSSGPPVSSSPGSFAQGSVGQRFSVFA